MLSYRFDVQTRARLETGPQTRGASSQTGGKGTRGKRAGSTTATPTAPSATAATTENHLDTGQTGRQAAFQGTSRSCSRSRRLPLRQVPETGKFRRYSCFKTIIGVCETSRRFQSWKSHAQIVDSARTRDGPDAPVSVEHVRSGGEGTTRIGTPGEGKARARDQGVERARTERPPQGGNPEKRHKRTRGSRCEPYGPALDGDPEAVRGGGTRGTTGYVFLSSTLVRITRITN